MTAGELLKAVQDDKVQQLLRSFVGSGVMYSDAPLNIVHQAGNVSAYVVGREPGSGVGNAWGPDAQSTSWATRGHVPREGEISEYTFRSNGTRQVPRDMANYGGAQGLVEGEGVVPDKFTPRGDWVAMFGGADHVSMFADGEWAVGGMRTLTMSGTRWWRNNVTDVPWYHRAFRWNTATAHMFIRVQPGIMIVNGTPAELHVALNYWGRPAAVRMAKMFNEARFLATRHTREGVSKVLEVGARTDERTCYRCRCAASTCTCEFTRRATLLITERMGADEAVHRRAIRNAERKLSEQEHKKDIVERARVACIKLIDSHTVTGYRASQKYANVFMGPFKLELDATTWVKGGVTYTWVKGLYEMPPVWVRIPWTDPGSVKVLDMDGTPHPHGHVGAGTDGMPCLGNRSGIQAELVELWYEDPGEFVMHWWNYMQQYNEVDIGVVGPIHTTCRLVREA